MENASMSAGTGQADGFPSPSPRCRFLRRKVGREPVFESLEERRLLAVNVSSGKIEHKLLVTHLFGTLPIQARMKKVRSPALTVSVIAGPDTDGHVTLAGKTYTKAKVTFDVGAKGAIEQTVKADAK